MSDHDSMRHAEARHDGFSDGLTPLQPLDLNACHDVDELVQAMARTALTARQVGEATEVLQAMIEDTGCFVVASLSGVMTVAKMGLIFTEMIDRRMIHAIVSTGALMSHGLIESAGLAHFKLEPNYDDKELYQAGYDRIHDTLELETNFLTTREIIFEVLDRWNPEETLCSYKFMKALGDYLHHHASGRGILKSAAEQNIPIYVPAFTDSEIGLTVALYNARRVATGQSPLHFDPFLDLTSYLDVIRQREALGIFTIGGGVPRNWAQQIAPYTEMLHNHIDANEPCQRFKYAVRICPDPAYWGGSSSATYSEGISWGKIVPTEEGGRWAEVFSEATLALPLMLQAVIQRIEKKKHASSSLS